MAVVLEGKVAVVTGASRGLGQAVAVALAKRGANVVIAARTLAGLEETAALIAGRTQQDALVVAADIGRVSDVEHLRDQTHRRFGDAAILVNAAGIYGPLGPLTESDPAEWIETLTINTVGPYLSCRFFVPAMVEARWGRVVNVSSAASLYPPTAFDSAYATSKTALNRLTRHLAAELEGTGVTANVLHPGSLKTEMWADIRAKLPPIHGRAEALRTWVEMVDRTGGDPLSGAVDLVLELLDDSSTVNGQFCWPKNALEAPVASW